MAGVNAMRPLFVFMAVLVFVGFTGSVAVAGPVVHLPEPVFEFEPIVEGIPVEHTFVLANRGDAPLKILAVKAG